jgi:hypothetical protein
MATNTASSADFTEASCCQLEMAPLVTFAWPQGDVLSPGILFGLRGKSRLVHFFSLLARDN